MSNEKIIVIHHVYHRQKGGFARTFLLLYGGYILFSVAHVLLTKDSKSVEDEE